MFDLKEKTYAVLEFVTIDCYYTAIETKNYKQEIHLNFPAIIEIAAVKIKDGKIIEHFSSFVGIDGFDERDLEFEDDSPELDGITAEHLIGAPSIYNVAKRLFEFTRDCTLITKYSEKDFRNPFNIVQMYMKPEGYVFNNPTISVNNIISAIKIREAIEAGIGTDEYALARFLEDKDSFNDLIAHYLDVDAESGRKDSLSRALITARLLIALTDGTKKLNPIDEPSPF